MSLFRKPLFLAAFLHFRIKVKEAVKRNNAEYICNFKYDNATYWLAAQQNPCHFQLMSNASNLDSHGMRHFPLIQALCRVAMSTPPTPALKKQIERLRDALRKDGEVKEAAALSTILTMAERAEEMAPSRLTRSKTMVGGEVLTRNTALPVDRETAAPLAQIVFPNQIPEQPPLFNETVTRVWTHNLIQ